MALSPKEIKNRYPLPVYNYRVQIGTDFIAFSEVSGLSKSFETTTYKESRANKKGAGPEIMYMPGQIQPINITLKRGITRAKNLKVLYDWLNTIQINQVEKKDISIQLTDEAGDVVITWKISNAFPTKLDAPTFDASSNEVAIESMELMADDLFMEEN